MFRVMLVAVLVLSAGVAGTGAVPAPDASAGATVHPSLVEVYPNPQSPGDDGEFVTLWVPSGVTLDAYALADNHGRVDLQAPGITTEEQSSATAQRGVDGRYVTFSTAPSLTASLSNRTVLALSPAIQLANDGDSVRLVRDGVVVDEVSYDSAPETEVYDVRAGTWRPLGATDRPVVSADGGRVEAFVLPDAPDRAVSLLDAADQRILLAGYTLSSPGIVDALVDAHERGVSVDVLVEGAPVSGMSEHAAAALDALVRAGVRVRVVGGQRSRYRYHHAKYAVADDRALVTTENWKPAGLGGASSRGWGVITGQERIVEALVSTFRADTGWVDAIPWRGYDERTVVEKERADADYPERFAPGAVRVERTRLLVAPDNAEGAILDTIDGATDSIDVVQVSVSDTGMPFLQALLDAAARGVEVRLLLSGQWYVEAENRRLKAWLDDQTGAADLPFEVRIANPPDGTFEKIHAKGLVVDGETVLVGSINWSNTSIRANREVALLLEGVAIADYFGTVFESDWQQASDGARGSIPDSVPLGYVGVVVVLALAALLVARRFQFVDSPDT